MNRTILVIEDDHDTRVAIRQALENTGHRIYSATNGSEGLRLLRKIGTPDLIVVDMIMPIMNGEEFIKAKEKSKEFAKIPLLVITSFKEKLALIGDNSFLMKPLDLDLLISKVDSYFIVKEA